jgi:hypothetical protein
MCDRKVTTLEVMRGPQKGIGYPVGCGEGCFHELRVAFYHTGHEAVNTFIAGGETGRTDTKFKSAPREMRRRTMFRWPSSHAVYSGDTPEFWRCAVGSAGFGDYRVQVDTDLEPTHHRQRQAGRLGDYSPWPCSPPPRCQAGSLPQPHCPWCWQCTAASRQSTAQAPPYCLAHHAHHQGRVGVQR